MTPNEKLAALALAGLDIADVDAVADKIGDKLAGAVILMLRQCDRRAGQRLYRNHPDAVAMVVKRMSRADLRRLSRAWNPHRTPAAAGAGEQELIEELLALAEGTAEPAPKPAPRPRRPNRRTAARSQSR